MPEPEVVNWATVPKQVSRGVEYFLFLYPVCISEYSWDTTKHFRCIRYAHGRGAAAGTFIHSAATGSCQL